VIDCGKTWHERIALVFPENGLRKIDGEQAIVAMPGQPTDIFLISKLYLTHEHADGETIVAPPGAQADMRLSS
jgi:hypothetical protein